MNVFLLLLYLSKVGLIEKKVILWFFVNSDHIYEYFCFIQQCFAYNMIKHLISNDGEGLSDQVAHFIWILIAKWFKAWLEGIFENVRLWTLHHLRLWTIFWNCEKKK